MSTPNFKRMKYGMPMICGRSAGQIAEEYRAEYGEEISDDELYFQESLEYEDAAELAETFSSSLVFHNVEVASGKTKNQKMVAKPCAIWF